MIRFSKKNETAEAAPAKAKVQPAVPVNETESVTIATKAPEKAKKAAAKKVPASTDDKLL